MYPEIPSNQLYLELAERFGSPLFVYDGDRIVANYRRLTSAFSEVPLAIKYAMKALPSLAILQLLCQEGAGVDAVSRGEVMLALKAGFKPSDITFTPSCPDFSEIEFAVEQGVDVVLDSLPLLEAFGKRFGSSVKCAVRIRPEIAAGGNAKIQTGHNRSKFGISVTQFGQIQSTLKHYAIALKGLHVHTGSDILDPEIFVQSAKVIFDLARSFPNLEFLDFGGGFKVSYKRGQPGVDVAEVGRRFTEEYQTFVGETGVSPEVRFEPGKYLVSDAGVLLVKVSVVKETPEECFLGVNSGLNHLIRPMFYDAYHEIWNLSGEGRKKKPYTVVGYICETDTFATDREIEETYPDDILAIANAGAYCFSMSSNFNSQLRPAEVLIRSGEVQLIRERESFEVLLQGQNELIVS